MAYYRDLSAVSLQQMQEILANADLLPSRQIILTHLSKRFKLLAAEGVQNTQELLDAMKTKKKLELLAEKTAIDLDYLTILNRELKSFCPKPNNIADFPEINNELVVKLSGLGIKNTLHLYGKVLTKANRSNLVEKAGIAGGELDALACMTDLSRIRWVNHTFAYVLYKAGYITAKRVANADYKKLYDDIRRLNQEEKKYKGQIGVHDMKLTVESARDLPHEIDL